MPCRDYDDEPAQIIQGAHNTNRKLKADLDKVTRLLCGTMKTMSEPQVKIVCSLVPDLKDWWEDHKLKDQKREAQEKALKLKKIAKLRKELAELEGK